MTELKEGNYFTRVEKQVDFRLKTIISIGNRGYFHSFLTLRSVRNFEDLVTYMHMVLRGHIIIKKNIHLETYDNRPLPYDEMYLFKTVLFGYLTKKFMSQSKSLLELSL